MCTNLLISVPSNPGSTDPVPMYVSARALELPGALAQSVYVMASGQQWPLPLPPSSNSPVQGWTTLGWTSTYGFVGIAGTDSWTSVPTFNDGINSEGLSVGALWLAPGTEYAPLGMGTNQVSFYDFPAWILGNFATVEEVRTALDEITVVGPPPPTATESSPLYVPLHYIVTDSTGQSLVVEFIGGKAIHYASDRGVLTNWPTYDWHATNVKNYFNLTPFGTATSPTGAGDPGGGGLLGLPGDPLSVSRFVKAWVLSQGIGQLPANGAGWLPAPGGFDVTPPPKNPPPPGYAGPEQTAVTVAQQLVQICMGTPYGMLLVKVENSPETTGTPATDPPTYTPGYGDYTMWTTVRDHTNRKYYFNPAFSGLLTQVDLTRIDFATTPSYPNSLNVPVVPQPGVQWCLDATPQLAAPVSS